MKIARLAGFVCAALMALSLALASVAAAAPEFKPSTKTAFTGTSGTSVLEAGGETITCEKDTSSGEITGAATVGDVHVHFLGCVGKSAEGKTCSVKSTGAPLANLIITNTLIGRLGLILPKPASGSDVGLLLLPASGKKFVTLVGTSKCAEETAVTGSLAGLAEPVGVSSKTGKLVFTGSAGKESITDIDLTGAGLVAPELVAFSSTAVQKTTEELTFAASVEVT